MIEKRHFPGVLLMESAGRKATEFILDTYSEIDHFLLLCGPGNNGGDGWVIARYLWLAGKEVSIQYSHDPEKYTGDAEINFKIVQQTSIPYGPFDPGKVAELETGLQKRVLIVDALLGTGITAALRGTIAEMIDYFRGTAYPVVAIDLPSGLSGDTGKLINQPLSADYTLTFHLPKVCHYVMPAAASCGTVVTIDIGIYDEVTEALGIQREVLTAAWVKSVYRPRNEESHKGTYGHALLIGGSKNMAGAIALAANSAIKSGAGVVTALIPASARCAFYKESLEVMTLNYGSEETEFLSAGAVSLFEEMQHKLRSVGIGPGLGTNTFTIQLLQKLFPIIKFPLVLDADALNILAETPSLWEVLPSQTIITPHPGEMARLIGKKDVQENRLEYAEALARKRKVIVVLKGAYSIIAIPDGRTYINPTGNAGMATAGAGDVLTGALVGLLAQDYPPEIAAPLAVYLHGAAGDCAAQKYGQEGVSAGSIADHLSPALKENLIRTTSTTVII